MFKNPLKDPHTKASTANDQIAITNINTRATIDEIAAAFRAFGEFETCRLNLTPRNESLGYAFIKYKSPQAASQALQNMNDFRIRGKPIKVGWARSNDNDDQGPAPGYTPGYARRN